MSLAIRLSRGGAKKRPYYRIVVANSRAPRDGRFIEKIGTYNPLLAKDSPERVKLDADRARHWLSVGAQPSEAVVAIFKRTGDWQKFSGDTSPSGVDAQKEKPSKLYLFNAALAEAGSEPRGASITSGDRSSRRNAPDSQVEGTQGEAQQAADAGAAAAGSAS